MALDAHDRPSAWELCPEHGPVCDGATCCCADLHGKTLVEARLTLQPWYAVRSMLGGHAISTSPEDEVDAPKGAHTVANLVLSKDLAERIVSLHNKALEQRHEEDSDK